MILAPTPNRVAVTGRAVASAGGWAVVDVLEAPFYAQMGNRVGGRSPLSPRERSQVWLRFPFADGEPPMAGSTMTVDGVPFEVCEDPGLLSTGTRVVGYELMVVQVSRAYPTTVSVNDPSGALAGVVQVAMWTPRESHDGRGERVDEQGEAPADLFDILSPRNTALVAGDATWRITSCVLDRGLGRVLLSLRNTRGAD